MPYPTHNYWQPMTNYGYAGYQSRQSPRRSNRPQKKGSPARSNRHGRINKTSEKQQIGEKLFPRVQKLDAAQAGKITGMLLEMDTHDLLDLLSLEHSEQKLKDKVREAQDVLMRAQGKK